MSPVLVGCLRRCRAASLVAIVLATILGLPPGAGAEEPLRPIAADQTSVEVPPGWKSIDRTTYDEYAAAVASGVMPLVDGGRFEVNRPVTGAEAVDAINRLQTLVR